MTWVSLVKFTKNLSLLSYSNLSILIYFFQPSSYHSIFIILIWFSGGSKPNSSFAPQRETPKVAILWHSRWVVKASNTHSTGKYVFDFDFVFSINIFIYFNVTNSFFQLFQGGNRFQEAQFTFVLSPTQATNIASNRDIQIGARLDFLYQVSSFFLC